MDVMGSRGMRCLGIWKSLFLSVESSDQLCFDGRNAPLTGPSRLTEDVE